ncbi:MAG: Holliday junction resolvase RuvX [Lachnospiraceae bacterium]|nr:Holliday junction resolvase RuvX [Lachnospiraceae bacterium]
MRIMGLDYGTKTVGVAVSDELLMTARATEIIRRKEANKLRRTLARIEELVSEYNISEIVLGLPLHMDLRVSEMAKEAYEFREHLVRRTGLPVTMWDERLSSVEAEEILRMNGVKKEAEKEYIDMVAAKVILESYLENRRREQA